MPIPAPNANEYTGHVHLVPSRWIRDHAIDDTIIATLNALKNKTFTPPAIGRRAGTAWRRPGPFSYSTTLSVSIWFLPSEICLTSTLIGSSHVGAP